MTDYLVQEEDGTSLFTLEEGGGSLLLEETAVGLDWILDGSVAPTNSYVGNYKVGNLYTILVDAEIVAARFWRHDPVLPAGELSHAVELWTPAGVLVATSATSAETAGYTGWVEVAFPAPIVTTAGQQWIAVFACSGHAYAATATLADAARATWTTGRYVAVPPGGFPANTNPPNYFVDLYFGEPVVPTTGGFVQIHHYFYA